MKDKYFKANMKYILLLLIFFAVFIWSAIHPKSYYIWLFESMIAILSITLLVIIYKRYRFSFLTCVLILIQASIILVGAHFTFQDVPCFKMNISEHLTKGYFDWIAHFTFGFVISFISIELIIYHVNLKSRKFAYLLVLSIALSSAAFWELIEWGACLLSSNSFDLTQGYKWDTQWDMFLTFLSAIMALPILKKTHLKSLKD